MNNTFGLAARAGEGWTSRATSIQRISDEEWTGFMMAFEELAPRKVNTRENDDVHGTSTTAGSVPCEFWEAESSRYVPARWSSSAESQCCQLGTPGRTAGGRERNFAGRPRTRPPVQVGTRNCQSGRG